MNINQIPREKCFGCFACHDVCREGAIHADTDQEGFPYPQIHPEKCINCGECVEVCPSAIAKPNKGSLPIDTVALWHTDERIRQESTSGGAFTAFAQAIFSLHGAVYGARFLPDMKLKTERTVSMDGLSSMRGSKYLQSDMRGVFRQIRQDIELGQPVLFSGTPCQNAAVANTFSRHGGLDKIWLVDIVCHGVNSPKVFGAYKIYLEHKYRDTLVDFKFRDKSRGWRTPITVADFRYKQRRTIFDLDPFIAGFRKNAYLRQVCFSCPYASLSRVSDLTIGDFWGAENIYNESKGVSLCLISTEKGKGLFDYAKSNLHVQEISLSSAVKNNPQLLKASVTKENGPIIRAKIIKLLNEGRFGYVFSELLPGPNFPKIKKMYYFIRFHYRRIKNARMP